MNWILRPSHNFAKNLPLNRQFLIKLTFRIITTETVSKFDFSDLYFQMIFWKQTHAHLETIRPLGACASPIGNHWFKMRKFSDILLRNIYKISCFMSGKASKLQLKFCILSSWFTGLYSVHKFERNDFCLIYSRILMKKLNNFHYICDIILWSNFQFWIGSWFPFKTIHELYVVNEMSKCVINLFISYLLIILSIDRIKFWTIHLLPLIWVNFRIRRNQKVPM